VRASYDSVAGRYTKEIADELGAKPLDRALLAAVTELAAGAVPAAGSGGPGPAAPRIWDVGCGPGHVTAHLAGLGARAAGLDLSPAMVEHARARNPDLEFTVGSMTKLPGPGQAWHGIVAFYSLIHLADDADLRAALREFRRVLTDGGVLLAAVHTRPPEGVATVPVTGGSVARLDSWWETAVDVSFRFFDPGWLRAEIENAGFATEAVIWRAPYPGAEAPTERAYLLARAGRAGSAG
jgi:SAM-dependent methyltransferase